MLGQAQASGPAALQRLLHPLLALLNQPSAALLSRALDAAGLVPLLVTSLPPVAPSPAAPPPGAPVAGQGGNERDEAERGGEGTDRSGSEEGGKQSSSRMDPHVRVLVLELVHCLWAHSSDAQFVQRHGLAGIMDAMALYDHSLLVRGVASRIAQAFRSPPPCAALPLPSPSPSTSSAVLASTDSAAAAATNPSSSSMRGRSFSVAN